MPLQQSPLSEQICPYSEHAVLVPPLPPVPAVELPPEPPELPPLPLPPFPPPPGSPPPQMPTVEPGAVRHVLPGQQSPLMVHDSPDF